MWQSRFLQQLCEAPLAQIGRVDRAARAGCEEQPLVLFAAAAVAATWSTDEFVAWAWARHHNVLSWYIRPLFILPFCYFAYRRSVWGIVLTLVIFPTSLFWFPAPENLSPRVEGYLAWESHFLTEGSVVARVALVVLVVAFFVALAPAFWRRS